MNSPMHFYNVGSTWLLVYVFIDDNNGDVGTSSAAAKNYLLNTWISGFSSAGMSVTKKNLHVLKFVFTAGKSVVFW